MKAEHLHISESFDVQYDWAYYKNILVISTNGEQLSFSDRNVTECMLTCMHLTTFDCLAMVTKKDNSNCTLYGDTRFTGALTMGDSVGFEYWELIVQGTLM